MRTKGIFLILGLSLVSASLFSQGLFNYRSKRGAGWLSGQLPDNARFSLMMGTSYSSFSTGTGMFGNYISPVLEYDLTPSFTLIAGGTFSFNRYSNLPPSVVFNSNYSAMQQGLTDHSLFAAGRYMITDNLFMTGSVYREEGHLPLSLMYQGIPAMNPGALSYQNQGMSMGIGYRINENFQFGAEIGVRRTNNPFHHYSPFSDPFGNRYNRSRHRISPF